MSLWTPILYVSVLFASLVVFSKVNQKRKLQKLSNTTQFFEYNFAKEAFEQLKAKENVPKKLLKSSLIAWGVENFTRLLRYRENEPIMAALLQRGEIGDEAFERFTGSKELDEKEMQEIVAEAHLLDPSWSTFMVSVQEITQQNAVRRRLAGNGKLKEEYKSLLPPGHKAAVTMKID